MTNTGRRQVTTCHFRLISLALVLTFASTLRIQGSEPVPLADKILVVEGQLFDHNGSGVAEVKVSLLRKPASDDAKPIATAGTNHYGDFKIYHHGPLTGEFVVLFQKPGYAEIRRDIAIIPNEPPPFVDTQLTGGLALSGTVRDLLEQSPIAGAAVRVTAAGFQMNVTTDENGAFQAPGLPPGRGSVRVDAQGFARHTRIVESVAEAEPLLIELSPERVVHIEVVDAGGRPIAAANIECLDATRDDYRAMVSDEHGKAEIRGLALENTTLLLRVSHRDFVSDADFSRKLDLPPDVPQSSHRVTLAAAGRVSGRITDAESQHPLRGARITAGGDLNSNQPRAWADFDGAYTLVGVPPGDTVITVYLAGYAPQLDSVAVASGQEASLDFALGPSKQAGGIVVDADGKPIARAYLFATAWRGYATLGVQALTGADGRFLLEDIPNDEFGIGILAQGFEPPDAQSIQPGKDDHRFELTARVGRSARPELKVGDPFPALEMVTLGGDPLTTADLKGKTVLIEFWATWCGPCVIEIPHLVKASEALSNRKDFQILSISLDFDQDDKRVRKFVKDKKMNWTHVVGKKGGAEGAADLCGVSGIPATFLIGPDGVLLARDLGGPTLKDQLLGFLKTKKP